MSSSLSIISEPNNSTTKSDYLIKWIRFNNAPLPIILQNENGPCPLIAICNVLLLRENMQLTSAKGVGHLDSISSADLLHKLVDTLFQVYIPRWNDQTNERNRIEKNVEDCVSNLNKLKEGMDVNVKFNGCKQFEYTRELDTFDLFAIQLYHGWLIDPQQVELFKHCAHKTYNQLIEFVLDSNSNSGKSNLVRDEKEPGPSKQEKETDTTKETEIDSGVVRALAETFLETTASQLTYYGLSELYASMERNELAVLFRNNHFSTIYKNPRDEKLYILCTDQGYLLHENIVWETLDNCEGDGQLCDSEFRLFKGGENDNKNKSIDKEEVFKNEDERCQNDYLIALSLQENQVEGAEEGLNQQSENNSQMGGATVSGISGASSNERGKSSKKDQRQAKANKKEKDTCILV